MNRSLRIAVPTVLSVLRLALAAAFPLVGRGWQAAAVVAAGVSDWLDGLAARRFGAVTRWGAILDPVCDKLFTLTALVTLAVTDMLAVWQILVLLARDMAVLSLAAAQAVRGRRGALRTLAARLLGKATTFGLFIFLTVLLAWPEATMLHAILFALTAALSILAAADYALAALWPR